MARLNGAAHALFADANWHLYSARSLPSIIRNLEALGEFLRQKPTQRDNRVLAVAVQEKEKVLADLATDDGIPKGCGHFDRRQEVQRGAEPHSAHSKEGGGGLRERGACAARVLEYEEAEEAANRLYRKYEEAWSSTKRRRNNDSLASPARLKRHRNIPTFSPRVESALQGIEGLNPAERAAVLEQLAEGSSGMPSMPTPSTPTHKHV